MVDVRGTVGEGGHLSREEAFALLQFGEHSPDEPALSARLAHLAACASCSSLLQEEAALESSCIEAGERRVRLAEASRRARRKSLGIAAAAALVLAAAVSLVLGLPGGTSEIRADAFDAERTRSSAGRNGADPWSLSPESEPHFAYEQERDSGEPRTNVRVLSSTTDVVPKGSVGSLQQVWSAAKLQGKRVRFSADVATSRVGGAGAGLFVHLDRGSQSEKGVDSKVLVGTNGAARLEVVVDVPAEASVIAVGAFLAGPGAVRVKRPTFETVGNDVPVTPTRSPSLPVDFED